MYRPTYLEVNCNTLKNNIIEIKSCLEAVYEKNNVNKSSQPPAPSCGLSQDTRQTEGHSLRPARP